MAPKDHAKSPSVILKILEVMIGIVSIGLLRNYHLLSHYESRVFLGAVTCGGFTMISALFLLGYFLDNSLGKAPKQEALANVIGTAMYLATGATAFDLYYRLNLETEMTKAGLAFGAIAVGNGIIYAIDTMLAYRLRE